MSRWRKKTRSPAPGSGSSGTARELGLDDDLANAGEELTVREAGKIGGNMVRKLIQAGKKALAAEEQKEERE